MVHPMFSELCLIKENFMKMCLMEQDAKSKCVQAGTFKIGENIDHVCDFH